jgi:hypothetical protein
LPSKPSNSRYSHTSVTINANAQYHSMYRGAPCATPRSIKSKSSTRFNAAMHTTKTLIKMLRVPPPNKIEVLTLVNADSPHDTRYNKRIPPVAANTPIRNFSVTLMMPLRYSTSITTSTPTEAMIACSTMPWYCTSNIAEMPPRKVPSANAYRGAVTGDQVGLKALANARMKPTIMPPHRNGCTAAMPAAGFRVPPASMKRCHVHAPVISISTSSRPVRAMVPLTVIGSPDVAARFWKVLSRSTGLLVRRAMGVLSGSVECGVISRQL